MTIRVLFLADSPQESPTGGGRTRILAEIHAARRYGYEPLLLCFVSPAKIFELRLRLQAVRRELARAAGCKVLYVPRVPFTRFFLLSRIADIERVLAILVSALLWRVRIVHAQSLDTAYGAILGRRALKKIRVIADIHGAVVAEHQEERSKYAEDSEIRRMRLRERVILCGADRLVFVSEAMREYFRRHGHDHVQDAQVIPCACEFSKLFSLERREQARRRVGVSDELVVSYLGAAEDYQMPEEMCVFFKELNSLFGPSYFLIISHHKDQFEYFLQKHEIRQERFKIVGLVHEEVPDWLMAADLGFLLRRRSDVNEVAFPVKFGEYCACGVPVLTTKAVKDVAALVEQYRLGFIQADEVFLPNPSLLEYLRELKRDRVAVAERCRDFVRSELSWDSNGEKLDRMYRSLGES